MSGNIGTGNQTFSFDALPVRLSSNLGASNSGSGGIGNQLFIENSYVYNTETSIATGVGANNAQGTSDPSEKIPGWYYISNGAGKIFWTFFEQYGGQQLPISLVNNIFSEIVIRSNEDAPWISVYTKRKFDGQDAAANYRSRFDYYDSDIFSGKVTGTQVLLYTAYSDERDRSQNTYKNYREGNILRLPLDLDISTGPMGDDEDIQSVVIQTNSSSTAGNTEFILRTFGILYNDQVQYNFTCSSNPFVTPSP
jgi:hypothetical protein